MRRSLIYGLLLAACLLGTAAAQQRASEELYWPKPPGTPRIQFLYAFSGKQDLGIEKSFWRKLADVVFGEEKDINNIIRPQGVTVDAEGRVYVTDIGAKGVHVFDFEEKEYKLITGSDDTRLVSPVGVAVSPAGSLYVSDSELGAILVFNRHGDYEFSISGELKRPTGLWLSSGFLYVVDTGANMVVVFDLDGHEKFRFGRRGVENGEFNFPVYVCAGVVPKTEALDKLYLVDAMNFRLQILQPDGKFLSKFGKLGDGIGDFARPKGVALDSQGHIYVADALYDVIQVFDQNGQILLAFGGTGTGFGSFYLPAGIAIDAKDRIYVVDSGNRRVQVFQFLQ
ncbi:MAG: 6-bladed beta-propeller [Bacteroidota bacterium]